MMKKFKLTLGLLVVIFVALLIYQNRAYFFAKQALSFILVPEKFQWTAPAVANVVYFGGCLLIGFLIAGYFGLVAKLRSMKTIKQINKTILSLESLKAELETFKENPLENDDTPAPDSEPPVLVEQAPSTDIVISSNDVNSGQTVNLNKE